MATKADRDEDEKDTDKDEADEDAAPAKKAGAKADLKKADAKPKPKPDDEEDDEDEDDKPAAKPSKAAAKADEDDEEEEAPAPKRAKGPGARGPGARSLGRGPGAARKQAQADSGGSLGKSVLLFFVIVIGLGALFYALGRETPAEVAKPKWKVGDVTDVEITLVKSDRVDLACATPDEIAGKHCAFEEKNKPWSKGPSTDDKTTLKPYTTAPPERFQFLAAGLWSEPAMAMDKLPATRFSVKCKLKIEGSTKNVATKWEPVKDWNDNRDWFAGTLSDCKVLQP
jgi:hypothetical protein